VTTALGWVRKRLLGIPLEEVTVARRGLRTSDASVRTRVERIGCTLLHGYHAALEEDDVEALAVRLNAAESELIGFAFEGAAMGLTLLDHLTPFRKDRLHAFLNGPGAAHVYMVHVGTGWALARLPWLRRRVERHLAQLDPLLRWLAVDGYGFHEGYFHWPRALTEHETPDRLTGYARRAFDQGLGRSLWFVEGTDVSAISSAIAGFRADRRADLWSGVGLAAAYAGGVDRANLERLRMLAAEHLPSVAQGTAFAAKARERAGNPADHTEFACRVLCEMSAGDAARITGVALEDLPGDGPEPAYEIWRQRIQNALAPAAVVR
jgi:enediyne biosynthesis protein E3